MAASRLHGLSCGEEAGARNLVFFRIKRLQATMKVPRVCGGCGWGRFMRKLVPPLCSATSGCVCLGSSMRFLNLWLLDWLSWIGLTVAAFAEVACYFDVFDMFSNS